MNVLSRTWSSSTFWWVNTGCDVPSQSFVPLDWEEVVVGTDPGTEHMRTAKPWIQLPHIWISIYTETPCSYSNVWKNKLTHQLLYSVADLQIQCTVHWTDLHMQQDGQFPTACLLFIPVHVDDEDYEGERLWSVDASKKYQISCWQIVRNKPTNKRITDISKEWKSTHIDRKSR